MAIVTSLLGSLVTFVVALLVGAIGIYVGAGLVTGTEDFSRAAWTAVFGAIGWTLVSLVVGWIPLLGGLLTFVLGLGVYLAVIGWRYDTSLVRAAAIAVIAYVTMAVVRWVLALVLAPLGVVF